MKVQIVEDCSCSKQFIRSQPENFQYFHNLFHKLTRYVNNRKFFFKLFNFYKMLIFQKNIEIPHLEIYIHTEIENVSVREVLFNKSAKEVFPFLHDLTSRRRELITKIVFKPSVDL